MLDVSTKTFSHKNKEERGKGVPLSYASRGLERAGGNTINKDGEMSGSNKAHHPTNPCGTKTKSFQHVLNIRPAKLVESFREIQLE